MFDGKYFDWNQKRIKGIVDYYGYKFFYGKKLADLGCGHADMSGVVYRLGSDITAVDARQEHLKIVSKKFPGIKTVKGNLDGPWPFHGQKFDMILDLGLVCHLASFESHLKAVCASTTYLVLETAVCDSDDSHKCIQVPEGKEVYDLAYNGMGCRPSPAAIERVLTECNMSFKRMDNAKFNSGEYVYDWLAKNDDSTSIYKRRIWFCTKNQPGVILPENAGQPAVMVQPPPAPTGSPYVHFANGGIPAVVSGGGAHIGPPPPVFISTASPKPPMMETSHLARPHSGSIRETNERFAITPGQPVPQFPNVKVLYLSLGEQQGMVDAFKAVGVQLEVFDFYTKWLNTSRNHNVIASEFLKRVNEFKPNLIHMQLQFTGLISNATITEARRMVPGVVITNWSGDVRSTVIPDFLSTGSVVDYSLISSTGQLDMYARAGCKNIRYWQIGFNPKINFPMHNTEFKYDISFLGNNYGHNFPDGNLRVSVATHLRNNGGIKFGLFGSGYSPPAPSVDPPQANQIYNDSICPLSISNFNSIAHYFSDRFLHCVASGRPTISWFYPGIEDYFKPDEEIFVARTVNDVLEIINRCKADMGMANTVGMNGYNRVLREHTFTSRVLELLNITQVDKL